jgi:hypothetical protein
MSRSNLGLASLLILLVCSSLPYFQPTGMAAPLAKQKFQNLGDAVSGIQFLFVTKIPIGLETFPPKASETDIVLDLNHKTVAEILDNLISQRPDYTWTQADGFYDIFPRAKEESLSQVTIRTFSLTEASPRAASDRINDIAEVQAWLTSRGLTRTTLTSGVPWPRSTHPITFTLTNVPFRSVMNRLANEVGDTRWDIERGDPQSKSIGINF